MRNPDFIANPCRVAKGENARGFRAVTAAENVTDNPLPRQDPKFGPNMNGDRWRGFPEDADYEPTMSCPSKRLGRGRGR